MKSIKKINWRRGNGEIIGFAASIALLFLVMVCMMYFTSYTTKSQQLTVATYCAGRAAAISQTSGLATSRANAVIRSMYTDGGASVAIKTNGGEWKKGNLFTVEVTQSVPWLLSLDIPGIIQIGKEEKTCSLVMMIEGEKK